MRDQPSSFCHDEQQFNAASAWLAGDAPRKVLVISGVVGSGRSYLVRSLAEKVAAQGRRTVLLSLVLDGFEPSGAGLPAFIAFRLELGVGRKHAEPVADQVRKLHAQLAGENDPLVNSSGRWAVAFASVLELEDPAPVLTELLATPALTPEQMLARVLVHVQAAGEGLCIFHVPADTTLSDPTAQWLLSTVFGQPKVALFFSCAPQLPSEVLVGRLPPETSVRRLDLPQLTEEQAVARLRDQAHAEKLGIAASQLSTLAQAAQGSEGRLARVLSATAAADASTTPRARLDAWFATLGDDEARLRRVLTWAAACGDAMPILPLLAACETSQADAERLIDCLDEQVCGDEAVLPLFEDLAYRHPGFPGLATYRFRDRSWRLALLDAPDAAAQQTAERELLQFLSTRMAVASRSIAQLFVNLSERVQFDTSAAPRQRLRLSVGLAEQSALENLLGGEVRAGRLPADALLRTALQDQSLPVHPRLALLDAAAVKEAELPHERRVMLASLRTELLCALQRFADALTSAQRGFELLGAQQPEPPGLRGLLLFLSANCYRQLGKVEDALASFKAAAEEAAKPRADGTIDLHNRGVCLAEAGHCHAERQEWGPAVGLLREGIAVLRSAKGDPRVRDEQVAQLEHNLRVCETKLQEASAAAT